MKELEKMMKISKVPSKFEKFQITCAKKLFYLLHILLQYQDQGIWPQMVILTIELFQFLSFPFALNFKNAWKRESEFKTISFFFQYFYLLPFFQNKQFIYQIFFYVCIIIIALVIIWMIYIAIVLGKKTICSSLTLILLRTTLYMLTTVFCFPFFQILLSMFNCVEIEDIESNIPNLRALKVNYYAPSIICFDGLYFFNIIIGLLFFLIFFALCYVSILGITDLKLKTTSSNAKINLEFDHMKLIIKALLCIIFCSFNVRSSWILCVLLFLFNGVLFYSFITKQPHLNYNIHLISFFEVTVFTWASIVLIIGKILETTKFNGCIPLFCLGVPILLLIIIYNPTNYIRILLPNLSKFQKGIEVLYQIRRILFLFSEIEHSRRSKILLKGYAFYYESQCSLKGCPLKRYLELLENKKEVPTFFLQHTELLFQNAIAKFPSCISLRLAYCFFLLEYLKKKRKANEELNNLSRYPLTYEEQFVTFRYQKLFEEHSFDINDDEDKINLMSNLSFKNCFYQFKQAITKVSLLYINFWSILLSPNQDQEQLTILSDYGTQIISEVEEIQQLFDKLQKIKLNDLEVICYYSDFLNDILNKPKLALEYKSKLKNVEDNRNTVDDTVFFNLDMSVLTSSDEFQYIVLSGQREHFGIVTNISLGICLLLGYTKNELIGKSHEMFMPEIFHKTHHKVLNEKIVEYNKESVNLAEVSNYKPTFKQLSVFAKTKARYLVQLDFKVALITTEQLGISFISKMSKDISNLSETSICHILTNNSFIIQNFTVNSVNLLGMNSHSMNNSVEISKLIKQFHEEFYKNAVDENLTNEQKIQLRRQIINKKFRTPSIINWKIHGVILDYHHLSNKNMDSSLQNSIDLSKAIKSVAQESFIMTVYDAIIGGVQEGYYFKFELTRNTVKSSQLNSSNAVANSNTNNIKDNTNENLLNLNNSIVNSNCNLNSNNSLDQFGAFKSTFIMNKSCNSLNELGVANMKSFIPINKSEFQIDSNNMAYLHNPKNAALLREEIKIKAMNKIQMQSLYKDNNKEKDESNSSIESDEYSITDESNEDESSWSDSIKDNNLNQIEKEKLNKSSKLCSSAQNNLISSGNEYYKVNMNMIKYSIYNFEKKTFVEIVNFPKKSQVDTKMYDDKEITPTEVKKAAKIEERQEDEINENDEKQTVLIKQIEYSLSIEESQPTIKRLKWVAFFILCFFLLYGSGWLVLVIEAGNQIESGYKLIKDSYKLLTNSLIAHGMIRELTLISQKLYEPDLFSTIINEATNITIKEHLLQGIKNIYNQSHNLNLHLVTTQSQLSAKHKSQLYNQTNRIAVIKDNLDITKFNMTLSAGFFELNIATFHIIHDLKEYFPTNNYIFFYLYNMNNNICIGMTDQTGIYSLTFINIVSAYKVYFYFFVGIGFALMIATFFIFAYSYDAVAKRKESYLEVFFEIGSNVIRNSLEKCERFTKKMQLDSLSDFLSAEENDIDDNLMLGDVNAKKNRSRSSNSQKNNSSKETMIIKIFYWVFITIVMIVSSFSFYFYIDAVDMTSLFIKEYESMNDVYVEYAKLHRNFREYLFDNTSTVDIVPIGEYFPNYINDFYMNIQVKNEFFQANKKDLPPGFTEVYNQLFQKDICNSLEIEDSLCNHKILMKSASYGLDTILNIFIEDIRLMKNKKIHSDISNGALPYKYNLTLNGHPNNDGKIPSGDEEKYYANSPIKVFNIDSTKRVKLLFDVFIQPGYLRLNEKFDEYILKYIQSKSIIFYSISSLYLFFVLCLYLFLWKPFEMSLNNLIMKTKNMLSIIPKEVLGTLVNIKKLLNINQTFNKTRTKV